MKCLNFAIDEKSFKVSKKGIEIGFPQHENIYDLDPQDWTIVIL
jgi:hypothetical protein